MKDNWATSSWSSHKDRKNYSPWFQSWTSKDTGDHSIGWYRWFLLIYSLMPDCGGCRTMWPAPYLALVSVLAFLGVFSSLFPVTGIPHSPQGIRGNASREESGRAQEVRMTPRYLSYSLKGLRFKPFPGEKNIFFVETSCAIKTFPKPAFYDSESGLRLSPRGACALEAAAAAHPTHRVYLVHTCDVQRRSLAKGAAPAYALAALSIPNVHLWAVPYVHHYDDTPLQAGAGLVRLRASRWPVEHASDVLRFLLLWKYGGTYLDLDVLMLRSLGEEKNFGCAETPVAVSAGALNFAMDDPGRRVANACIAELLDYRPDQWGYNGPGAITRALKKVCNVQEVPGMTEKKCGGFHLLPTSTFYSIPWRNWNLFFTEKSSEETMKVISKNLAVHVWNSRSHNTTVYTSSKQPYAQIARGVCPNVVAAVGDTM